MKRRMLFIFVFLVCIVVLLTFAAAVLLKTSPSELLLRCVFAGYVLMKKPPPMPPPSEIFRQHILDPIPESVTNIKADQPKKILGYRYAIRFNINRVDLVLLTDSQPFERVWNVKYRDGRLRWDWDPPGGVTRRRISMIVYHPNGPRKPAWFSPDLWDNPEAYAFRKVDDHVNTKVLLYNEKEGEAYFIVSSLK